MSGFRDWDSLTARARTWGGVLEPAATRVLVRISRLSSSSSFPLALNRSSVSRSDTKQAVNPFSKLSSEFIRHPWVGVWHPSSGVWRATTAKVGGIRGYEAGKLPGPSFRAGRKARNAASHGSLRSTPKLDVRSRYGERQEEGLRVPKSPPWLSVVAVPLGSGASVRRPPGHRRRKAQAMAIAEVGLAHLVRPERS